MEMVAEMMPKKVSMCRNVTRYEEKCLTKMSYKMVEEKRPICKLEKIKKKFPKSECRKVAAGQQEECVDMVKLQEEQHEVKKCSFQPKTICRPVEGVGCRMVRKKMCNYIDSNQ